MKYSMQHIPAICAQYRQNMAAFSFMKKAVFYIISNTCHNPFTTKQRLACCNSVPQWPPIPKPTKTFAVFKAAQTVKNLHCHT